MWTVQIPNTHPPHTYTHSPLLTSSLLSSLKTPETSRPATLRRLISLFFLLESVFVFEETQRASFLTGERWSQTEPFRDTTCSKTLCFAVHNRSGTVAETIHLLCEADRKHRHLFLKEFKLSALSLHQLFQPGWPAVRVSVWSLMLFCGSNHETWTPFGPASFPVMLTLCSWHTFNIAARVENLLPLAFDLPPSWAILKLVKWPWSEVWGVELLSLSINLLIISSILWWIVCKMSENRENAKHTFPEPKIS